MASIPPLLSERCDLKEKKNFLLKVRAQKCKKRRKKKRGFRRVQGRYQVQMLRSTVEKASFAGVCFGLPHMTLEMMAQCSEWKVT